MPTNRQRIEALLVATEKSVAPWVEGQLQKKHGPHWRQYAKLPKSLSPMSKFDAHAALYAIVNNWHDSFQDVLPPDARDAASAAFAGRNAYAHTASELEDDKTLRALSGGKELLKLLRHVNEAAIVGQHFDELQQQMVLSQLKAAGKLVKTEPSSAPQPTSLGSSARPQLSLTTPSIASPKPVQEDLLGGGEVGDLKPWRIVMPPREEVLSGSLNKDAFAANLAVVDRSYQASDGRHDDPIAFFEATHLTRGLQLVLERAARRFLGGDAPSTIGLQTNFGGGKTHTLLALLHMSELGDLTKSRILDSVRTALGTDSLPAVRTAVFSGVDKGPNHPLDIADGHPIRTLWGYLAWRLAGREGLQLIAESEVAGTSPGAQAVQRVLELTGDPSLILLDELVVYVRQLRNQQFEAHLSFLQALTEAASQVPTALVVGSLPESDVEAGQEQGREALRRLEKLFGRVQSAWEPAQGTETYAVVRRRLFQSEDDAGRKERKRTVDRFHKLYKDNKADFPPFASQPDYVDRMMSAYPVHPMLFDILSTEWGALDKFQRTRGVLSLIARVTYALYMHERNDPLILPSSIRMEDPATKGALIEPLNGPVWSSVIDAEVDGDRSLGWTLEQSKRRYGASHAGRRAARSVFLATAPGDGPKAGITGAQVRLACVTPGEQLSLFPEALRELTEMSAHLYLADGRFWYGSRPTLNRIAQLREQEIEAHAIDADIVRLLREDNRPRGTGWVRIHVVPDQALQVPDERSAGLVILGPRSTWDDSGKSPAEVEARDGLERRSGGQRRYRNTLVFLAVDARALDDCRRLVRKALAWKSVVSDAALDLSESQRQGARASADAATSAALRQVRKAWTHLLVPATDPKAGSEIIFDHDARKPTTDDRSAAENAWNVARQHPYVVEELGPRTLGEKVREFWKPEQAVVLVDEVRDWHFQYLHMDRPRDEQVVAAAIANAAATMADPPFGVATSYVDGAFRGLTLSKNVPIAFGVGAVLVKADIARSELNRPSEDPKEEPAEYSPEAPRPGRPSPPEPSGEAKPRRFHAIVQLDRSRGSITAGKIFENIVSELKRADDAVFSITLELQVESISGFDQDVVDVVSDNAKSIGLPLVKFDR